MRREAIAAPLLGADDEHALALRAQSGDAAAFEQLVRSHMRLVLAIATELSRGGAELVELVGEGMLGLVIAARRFDPARGTRLAVYAAHWIRSLIRRHVLANRRIVRAPSSRNGRHVLAHLARSERELSQRLGAAPDRDLLAAQLGVTVTELEEARLALRGRDVAVGGEAEPDRSALELVSAEPTPESIVADAEQHMHAERRLSEALQNLAERERKILRSRLQHPAPSLAELALGLGISGERVRQLEARGLEQLHGALARTVA
jgi:RNA polymerase sigma-32 factor